MHFSEPHKQQHDQHRKQLSTLLYELENALKKSNLWQINRPSKHALSSKMPFAIDTLSFPAWLQFIFIEKMTQILHQNTALPNKMAITEMAVEYFKHQDIDATELIAVIENIDLHFNKKITC